MLAVPPPVLEQKQDQHDNDDDEDDAARGDADKDGHLGADDVGRFPAVVVSVAFSRRYTCVAEEGIGQENGKMTSCQRKTEE